MILRVIIIINFIFFSTGVFSKDIPIIVIPASKKPQSLSTVGTSVTILDENFLMIRMNIFWEMH